MPESRATLAGPLDRDQLPAESSRADRAAAPGWGPGPWLTAAGALAVAVLLLSLVLGGGRPAPAIPGLPDAGLLTGWGLPLARLLFEVLAVGTVGVLLTGSVLVPAERGGSTATRGGSGTGVGLTSPARRAVRAARWWAGGWALTALAALALSVSDTLGVPLPDALAADGLRDQLGTSRTLALLVVAALAAAVAVAAGRVRTRGAATVLLGVALLALLPTTVTGHSASAGDHDLAVTSLAVHVVAASLWVGGLLAMAVHLRSAPSVLAAAAPRFSVLALAAFTVLGMSGVLAATTRIGTSWDAWVSGYGALVAGKAGAMGALGVLGWQHRRRALPDLAAGRPRAFLRLAGVEVLLMAAAVGLAVALSRTPTPSTAVPAQAPDHGAGHETLATDIAPVTLARLVTEWRPDALVIAAVGLALAAYLTGVRTLAHRGEPWSPWRTASAVTGLAVALFALDGGLATYAPAMVSAQLAQFLLVALVVPALLVLAAPYALWLRARAPGTGEEPDVPSRRLAEALSDPFRGLLGFAALLFVVYRTPLIELSLRNFAVHLLVNVLALAAGLALLWPALAVDAVPRRRGVGERLLSLAAVVGLLLLLASQLRYGDQLLAGRWFLELRWPWLDPVDDQRLAAVVVAAAALALMPLMAVAARPQGGGPARRPATGRARPGRPPSPTGPGASPRPRPSRGPSPRRGSRRRP